MSYHKLTLEEREVISQMHYSGAGPARIVRRLNRSPSTISRALNRNSDSAGYRAVVAQEQTSRRRRKRPLIRKMDDSFINESVRTGLSQERFLEEIAAQLSQRQPAPINRDSLLRGRIST